MLIVLCNISSLCDSISNGTGIVSDIENYTFTPFLSGSNYIVQEFSPRYSHLESIEIRLANEWPDDIDCVLSFIIKDAEEEIVYEEKVPSDTIENWRYYKLNLHNELKKKNKYSLIVQCSENYNPSVNYNIFLCNMELRENINLNYNGSMINGGLDLIYNYDNVVPVFYLIIIISSCFISVIIVWLSDDLFKKKYFVDILWIISAIVNLFLVEYLSGGDFTKMSVYALLINLCLLVGFCGLLKVIFPSSAWAVIFTNVFVLLFALVNHYAIQFRGTVILPSDVYSWHTAANVVENYHITLDKQVVTSIMISMGIIVLSIKTNKKNESKKRCIYAVVAVISLYLPIMVSVNPKFANKLGVTVAMDRQTLRSNEIGFLLNFAENIQYVIVRSPEGYSLEKAENIISNSIDPIPVITDVDKPNIIVIMNESFSELRYLGDLETTEEYMENFYRAGQSENSKIGKCVVSVFGGGTSCSEFEALTGSTMLFFGGGNAPYQQYIHSETNSMTYNLKNLQYATYALHAANPKSWNRDVAYPLLGFDEFINSESEEFEEASYCRYWIDDKSLIDEVILLQDEYDPVFSFALTIQCHGGYDYSDYETSVEVRGLSDTYEEINQYLSLIKGTDEAFGTLINALEKTDQPTIVLMFGDHLPNFSSGFYEEMKEKRNTEDNTFEALEMYMTPYIFWANYDVDLSSIPDVLSANYLGTYLLQAAGVEMDYYNKYLYTLSRKYPVVSKYGVISADGQYCSYEVDDPCYEDIHDYEIMQYYNLFAN